MAANPAGAVAGDVNDIRRARLGGVDSLAGQTAAVARVSYDGKSVDLEATVVDEAERLVAVNLGDAAGWLSTDPPPAEALTWEIEITVFFGTDRDPLTFPAARPDRIAVRHRLPSPPA